MIRTFIAVKIPEFYLKPISTLLDEFKKTGAAVRWVKPESIHVTLKFLGNIREELVDDIAVRMSESVKGKDSFELKVRGCGAFPSLRNPRVIWLGIQGRVDLLCDLHAEIERRLIPLGFAAENRPFKAHLTLGRVKGSKGKGKLISLLGKKSTFELKEFRVSEVFLMKSELKRTGAVYTPLRCINFGKPVINRLS